MKRKFETNPESLAEELLGRPYEELDEDEQRVFCRLASTEIELDPDELEVNNMSFGDRMADRVAAIGGSWGFIGAFVALMAVWMALNVTQLWGVDFDPFPFILLNLSLSTLAALQAPIILMSQNRQAKKDRISNRHDYEVNLRTTLDLLRLHRKVDRIFNKLGQMQGSVEEVALTTEAAVEQALATPPGEGDLASVGAKSQA